MGDNVEGYSGERTCSSISLCATHSVGPLGEVPVGDAGPHVALLASIWAEPRVALVVVHNAALIAEAAHAACSSSDATVHRALMKKSHFEFTWIDPMSHYDAIQLCSRLRACLDL